VTSLLPLVPQSTSPAALAGALLQSPASFVLSQRVHEALELLQRDACVVVDGVEVSMYVCVCVCMCVYICVFLKKILCLCVRHTQKHTNRHTQT
jgi:hypothetical protein